MADEHQEQPETERERAIEDLDVSTEDAEQVTGGASADPDEGGERPGR